MARPRMYRDKAEKQRIYRLRKTMAGWTKERRAVESAQNQHNWIACRAEAGDTIAKELLGETWLSTCINFVGYLDRYVLYWAHQEALRRLDGNKNLELNSGQ